MYLLMTKDRHVSVEELVDVFWEESDLDDGKNKLYNTIYLLRKSLAKEGIPKNIIESVNGGYCINSDYQIWCDWECFEKKTEELIHDQDLNLKEMDQLFKLYRGDFFPSLRYESWTEINREKYRENYLDLIEIMSEKYFEKQKYRDTANCLHKGIEYDPYRENFYLLYIKALVKLGRIAEAINSYKKCEQILKEELDVFPGEKLKNEYHRIKLRRDLGDEVGGDLNFDSVRINGAMICDIDVFQKIYELESRHVKRQEKEFIFIKVDFSGIKLSISLAEAAEKVGETLRACDIICTYNKKMYLLLRDISLTNSGIIMYRFNQFCQKLGLSKKPSIDIKEIN
jgi:DNA-binding SARP family transcriptional activator